jgi:hypothetical protein
MIKALYCMMAQISVWANTSMVAKTIMQIINIDSKRYIWRILTSNEGAEPLYENKQFIGRIHKTDFSSDAYVYLGLIDKFGYDVALRLLQDDYAGYHKKFEEYTSGKQPIKNLVQNTTSA